MGKLRSRKVKNDKGSTMAGQGLALLFRRALWPAVLLVLLLVSLSSLNLEA